MRHLVLFLIVFFTTLPAQANMSDNDIKRFTTDYAKVYETCNLQNIMAFVDKSFADNYVASFISKSNPSQAMQAGKSEIMGQMQQSLDLIKTKNLTTSNCNTNVSVTRSTLNGNTANVEIIQVEQMTLQTPQGQTIPMMTQSQCVHVMAKQNNKVQIIQSNCMTE